MGGNVSGGAGLNLNWINGYKMEMGNNEQLFSVEREIKAIEKEIKDICDKISSLNTKEREIELSKSGIEPSQYQTLLRSLRAEKGFLRKKLVTSRISLKNAMEAKNMSV